MLYKPNALVSIVVTVYNGEKYLDEQLESIINQTYLNTEIIIINDCSTDNSETIIKKYKLKHSNIIDFYNQQNLGYIKSFEKGMALSNGDYIACSDHDDWWFPQKLELMVTEIGNYPLIYCDSELVNENLESLGKNMSSLKNLSTYNNCLVFATDNCIAGHATLITKTFFNQSIPFPTNIPHDWWLAYNACFYGGTKYLNIPLVKYRNHSSNIIGAIATTKKTKKNKKEKKAINFIAIKNRIAIFKERCNNNYPFEKQIIAELENSYSSFSFQNNLKRVSLFFKNKETLLAIKKRENFRKFIFCFKMFFKIK